MKIPADRSIMAVRLPRGRYYGRLLATQEIAGLILTEKRHLPGERLPPHAHEQPYLCLVLAGSWKERFDGGERRCTPKSVIYHPAGEVHSDDFEREGARLFAMELDASWQRRLVAARSFDEPQAFDGSLVATTALRLYDEARRNDASPLMIEGLMCELLGACLRSHSARTNSAPRYWLLSIEETLCREFKRPPSLGELAKQVGIHAVHLARAFRTQYGCSIGEFVREQRLTFVCRQLVASKRPVAEIALEAGYADQSHLTKSFRRRFGTTPVRYRAAGRLT